MKKLSLGRKTFLIINVIVLVTLALLCLLPLVNVLSVSLSSKNAAAAGLVKLWPVEFTVASYRYALSKSEFIVAMGVSVKRLLLGVSVNMLLTILVAYPLSKNKSGFKARSFYTWFFLITILFNGGLIPTYMAINTYGLIDSIWALVLPMAVPVFHVVILMNFFRELPKELEEAAFLDGAGHWDILWRVYVPLSKPALATLILFCAVFHWNSWFDGILYMNRPAHYPLQSYLQTVIINRDLTSLASGSLQDLALISERTTKASQVFIGAIPILLVYPFLQPYFVKGMVLGSVKG
jgi:putative aldouronate transport system permease protein